METDQRHGQALSCEHCSESENGGLIRVGHAGDHLAIAQAATMSTRIENLPHSSKLVVRLSSAVSAPPSVVH